MISRLRVFLEVQQSTVELAFLDNNRLNKTNSNLFTEVLQFLSTKEAKTYTQVPWKEMAANDELAKSLGIFVILCN